MRLTELAMIVFVVWPAACGSDSGERAETAASATGAAATGAGASSPCAVEHLGSEPLLLGGGREAYVEPQALAVSPDGTLLVAGAPSYQWRRVVAPRGVVQEGRNLFVAVRRNSDGADVVPPPPGIGEVQHVRATRLPSGGWGAVMSTGTAGSEPGSTSFDATWYAEYDGRSWSEPELLPRPADGEPRPLNSSGLVALGDRVIWIVPWDGPLRADSLFEFERRHGAWAHRSVAGHGFVETVGLVPGRSNDLWLVAAGLEPEVPDGPRSLRLYRHDGQWELVHRLAELSADAYAEDPRPVLTRGGVSVTWLHHDLRGSIPMAALDVQPDRPPRTVALAQEAFQVVPLALHDGTPAWVLAHPLPSVLSSELLVLVDTADGPRTVLALPNPYTGYFAATAHGRRITIAGPEFDPHPAEPTVRSLIIDLGASCQ